VKAALLIVDVQAGLVELMPREVRDAVLTNIAGLLGKARSTGLTVLFIQHDGPKGHPLEVNTSGWAIMRPLSRATRNLSSESRRPTHSSKPDSRMSSGRAESSI